MLRVGITGGIGSGKTTICQLFELLNVPVYYADDRAKWLINNDPNVKSKIVKAFGTEAYLPKGDYNRKYISGLVFNDGTLLNQLNAIVHPAVFKDAEHWQRQHENSAYTLREAALLFESGSYLSLDRILFVYCPKAIRLERVVKRDDVTAEEVQSRMAKQWDDDKKQKMSDDIIVNDGSRSIIDQVLSLHNNYLELGSRR